MPTEYKITYTLHKITIFLTTLRNIKTKINKFNKILVKPGDPQLEVKFPELSFPKDFSEFMDLTVSVASSIKQALMPPPTKEAESKPEKKE